MTEKDEAESSKETTIWTDLGTDEDKGEVQIRGLEQRDKGWGERRNLRWGLGTWFCR